MNAIVSEKQDFSMRIVRCQGQVEIHQGEIRQLESELKVVASQLAEFADERRQYEILASLTENLEKLAEVGANALFWDGLANETQIEHQLNRLRDKTSFFERRIKKVTDKQDSIQAQIKEKNIAIDFLLSEIEELKELEEESRNQYEIVREVRQLPVRLMVMPWTKNDEDEKKYRKILLLALLLCMNVVLIIPQIRFAIPDRVEVVPIPERLAKMIKKQPPKPKPKPLKAEEPKPEKAKKPTPEERNKARKHVANKGVLAFRNNLAKLLDDTPESKLGANASLSNAGSTASRVSRHILTSQATSGSGGIRTSSLSHDVAGTGSKLGAVAFSRVTSDIGTGTAEDRPLSDSPGPSRTDEEIQIVFDRYKAALYRIYNRELRANPTLQGKMVIRLTIEPNGTVSLCRLESTNLDSKTLVAKILARVKQFNFGPKAGVPKTTILYPIDFLPAS